jgi:hypothetical protein
MKTYLIVLLALLGFIVPAYSQTTTVPKIISDGFAAYKTDGATKAVNVWFAGSAISPATLTSYATYLTNFEQTGGKYIGYEVAGVVTLSPSVKYYYLVFLYQNSPLYTRFEVYSNGGQTLITTYFTHNDPNQVFPASFFVKNKGD